MPTDKEIKKEFKAKASKDPDKYYATKVLKEEGFMRKQCKCGTFFWTINADQKTCGDPACSGGFRFFEGTPAKNKLDYIQVWKRFAELFKKWGYTPIERYPVVSRWRDDMDFVMASICDFQPYVVSGEVKPPANPLVVPQFCLRFNDIDNVGITGAHYTGFVMIGQHTFVPPEQWDQAKYFRDIHNWLKQGLGLPNKEITFHEDAWAGGGNFGPCMEFFSRGLELGNQVYMMYEVTPSGPKELKLKVLDMGMGHERNAWFTMAKSTSYETTFPTVCKKLYSMTGIKVDEDVMKRFLPYSSYLNVDEVEDINKTWDMVAKNVGLGANELKKKVLPLSAIYSIAEHTRSLLFALNDGALPSNVGGGYNLRIILRRALSFIDKYGWKIDLPEVAEWHAEYLKPLFPELMENLDEVSKILDVEKTKYNATKQKSREIVGKITKAEKAISEKTLLELYDSQGISPEIIKEEAEKLGNRVDVPDDFYTKVASMHEKKEQVHATVKEEKLDLEGLPDTKALYFDDYSSIEFEGKVLKIIGKNVVLDRTAAYPTSGGQLHDNGTLNGEKFADVFKQGSIIIHVMEHEPGFKEGSAVNGKIEFEKRKQLSQHHTSTHIVNAAAKIVLGNHINQAGAKKTEEKAHLDITHYQSLTDEEMKRIEDEANKIVKRNLPVKTSFMPREEAERMYGMAIYQGGAVPGKMIRVVEVPTVDVEACGGTHLKTTGEAGEIKILKSTKIQDGIVRITFTAGKAAEKEGKAKTGVLEEAAKLLGCKTDEVPGRVEELFRKWKDVVKKGKKPDSKGLSSTAKFDGDILAKTSDILRTPPEHIISTIKRFLKELGE
ncbi:alanine--tRNA ligase [Candidatus Woesearchaeota archaeon CG10_big_fil_rev_8_21_14_0_10_44_13]|nr:MAG: alanine--tRNA ligase [Candidatus Woesearchaeota archaeon CG10_big_fil_rev_8_21_14_0_10_44_13]